MPSVANMAICWFPCVSPLLTLHTDLFAWSLFHDSGTIRCNCGRTCHLCRPDVQQVDYALLKRLRLSDGQILSRKYARGTKSPNPA